MNKRLPSDAGIAIGVLLFALAIIAAVTIALTGGNMMGNSTATIDRINAEVRSQADLIKAKIIQCYNDGLDAKKVDCQNNTFVAGTGWTRAGCSPIDTTAFYPTSTGTGTAMASVTCPSFTASSNLWTGQQPTMLPPPSNGLAGWYYVNAGDSGGRCIRIQPVAGTVNDATVRAGLAQATNAFSANEVVYSAGSASQRFILWITRPSGAASADCSP